MGTARIGGRPKILTTRPLLRSAVGIDTQPGTAERLNQHAKEVGVTNLTVILGDASQPCVDEASFDLVFQVHSRETHSGSTTTIRSSSGTAATFAEASVSERSEPVS